MTATTEPICITAGDTIVWSKTLSDYPASAGWQLTYTLINSATRITIAATASGDMHKITVAASVSAAFAPGAYAWQATVTKAAERHTVAKGQIQIAPDLAAPGTTTFDNRTTAKKALDAADAALVSYGGKAYLHLFEINGRKQQFHTPGEFLSFRSKLQAEVAREVNAARILAGYSPLNQIAVRFNTR